MNDFAQNYKKSIKENQWEISWHQTKKCLLAKSPYNTIIMVTEIDTGDIFLPFYNIFQKEIQWNAILTIDMGRYHEKNIEIFRKIAKEKNPEALEPDIIKYGDLLSLRENLENSLNIFLFFEQILQDKEFMINIMAFNYIFFHNGSNPINTVFFRIFENRLGLATLKKDPFNFVEGKEKTIFAAFFYLVLEMNYCRDKNEKNTKIADISLNLTHNHKIVIQFIKNIYLILINENNTIDEKHPSANNQSTNIIFQNRENRYYTYNNTSHQEIDILIKTQDKDFTTKILKYQESFKNLLLKTLTIRL